MDHPLNVLRQEHRVIELVLASLEKMTNLAERDNRMDVDSARDMIDFFRYFAGGSHHAKEEKRLFPLMESKGFPTNDGPTAVIREEHKHEHELVAALETATMRIDAGEFDAIKQFIEYARRYSSLLRGHIEKEDRCLFPMAEQFLSQDDQHTLHLAFCDHEENDKRHAMYLDLAQRIADRFGIAPIADDGIPYVASVHGAGKR